MQDRGFAAYSQLDREVEAFVKQTLGIEVSLEIEGKVYSANAKSLERWRQRNTANPQLEEISLLNKTSLASLFKKKGSSARALEKIGLGKKINPHDFTALLKAIANGETLLNEGLREKDEERLRRAIFHQVSLGNLPSASFLRGKEKLQLFLKPEIEVLLKEVDRLESQGGSGDEIRRKKFEIKRHKAELALNLGIKPKSSSSGANGALLLRDPFAENKGGSKNYVAVFKPPPRFSDDFKGFINRLLRLLKNYFGQARLLNRRGNAEQYAEKAADHLQKFLKLRFAPEVDYWKLKVAGEEVEGAVVGFLDGYSETTDEIMQKLQSVTIDEEEKSKPDSLINRYQESVLGLCASGQLDAHIGNLFARQDKEGNVIDFVPIDFGNAFRESNPLHHHPIFSGNVAGFAEVPLSTEDFTPYIREEVTSRFSDDIVTKWANKVNKEANFATEPMIEEMRKRFRAIREGVGSGVIKTPKELSQIVTDEDFQELFEKIKKKN